MCAAATFEEYNNPKYKVNILYKQSCLHAAYVKYAYILCYQSLIDSSQGSLL